MRVEEVIEKVMEFTGTASAMKEKKRTVDFLIEGNLNMEVKGIVTTFICSIEVIRKSIKAGANFIITHEPTYYNSFDETEWLGNDDVYLYKKKLINDNDIAIWRFHDALHLMKPDGIVEGVIHKLQWEKLVKERMWGGAVIEIPLSDFSGVALYVKEKIGASSLRLLGNPDMPVKRIGIMVGAQGGREQITFFNHYDVNVLICGEINEWEVNEYVRDCLYSQNSKALIVTGHYESEEAGMEYIVELIKSQIQGLPVTYIDSGKSFTVL